MPFNYFTHAMFSIDWLLNWSDDDLHLLLTRLACVSTSVLV